MLQRKAVCFGGGGRVTLQKYHDNKWILVKSLVRFNDDKEPLAQNLSQNPENLEKVSKNIVNK